MAGCLIAAVTYFPLFGALTHYVNPDLEAFQAKTKITVTADPATVQLPHLRRTVVEVHGVRPRQGCADQVRPVLHLGECAGRIAGRHPDRTTRSSRASTPRKARASSPPPLKDAGFQPTADLSKVNWFMAEVILVIILVYVTMVYGPIAAFLVELFPTNIRYTSMSLPYHIGNGWFGGMLPLLATALVAWSGDIYYGLWYPIGIAVMTLIIGTIFLRETKDVDITK